MISDPGANEQEVVLVNSTSIPNPGVFFDDTCIVRAGEHERITHRSYFRFGSARIVPRDQLKKQIEDGEYAHVEDATSSLLERLRDGLLRSPHAPDRAKDILMRQQR